MKVLVLGHKGMLGHMVSKYLYKHSPHECLVINGRFPNLKFKNFIRNNKYDFVVNCIGAIPQRTSNFKINYDLPIWLEKNIDARIIHAGTDCEMDSDDYGISKKIASDYIKERGSNTKIIKTSIIGPELQSKASLLYWFLNSDGEVSGYTKAMWNGNTTLEWAKHCLKLIDSWDSFKTETVLHSECISKYDLLKIIKEVYKKDINIKENQNVSINKCLYNGIHTPPIRDQLIELKSFNEAY